MNQISSFNIRQVNFSINLVIISSFLIRGHLEVVKHYKNLVVLSKRGLDVVKGMSHSPHLSSE